ncbi:polyprenyl synthetase family protein [Haliea sp. E1-2-M8]|uniref:polyprenyl synthetase family protein n=1 Tax=Haliea sp. E1-2-M8 TaxID=3064706 RepID=UPI002725F42D|nr:farnesyl diphosphate synthase [Haliea sp. E1-2-M8]MDO8863486.1 polyprenyl synthetase family protein [Haliea sp. E1-2-M8]
MSDALLAEFMARCRERCEAGLQAHGGLGDQPELARGLADFEPAVRYALETSGKCIRPCLLYAAARAAGAGPELDSALDNPACALELIHTYSLIHDDLPAMDDDDLRRGRPTLHKAFDEATAILVGDGLQARAFELLVDAHALSAEQKVSMIKALAQAAGLGGMVGGQFVDIASTGRPLQLEELQGMHALKTGALIRAALSLGAIAASASASQRAALERYGEHIGLAFQVVDDILDVEGSTATLGKTGGKDAAANKTTYVSLLGLAGARESAEHLLDGALEALEGFGDSADMLRGLARIVVDRRV